jgi:hypothetical protein
MSDVDRKARVFSLMARFNQLGRLLPAPDDFDPDGATAVAEAQLVIAEMNETQAKMDALRRRRGAGNDLAERRATRNRYTRRR